MPLKEYTTIEKKERFATFLEQESLFRALNDFMDTILPANNHYIVSPIEDWDEAKLFVKNWLAEKFPKEMFSFHMKMLDDKCENLEYFSKDKNQWDVIVIPSCDAQKEATRILAYVYIILKAMYQLHKDELYKSLSEHIYTVSDYEARFCEIIKSLNTGLSKGFLNDTIVADYDYVNNRPYNAEGEETEEDIEDDEEDIAADEENGESLLLFKSKQVPMEIMRQLLEKAGADFKKTGTQKPAAQLVSAMTGIPFNTCKNYINSGELNQKLYKNDIDKANELIEQIGLDIEL